MRSTNNTRSAVVGIFTIIGIAILVITILTLGSQRKIFMESLSITAYYPNVNGLQAGNNVWFGGVKVGNIKSVNIVSNDRVEVRMNIDQTAKKYIHNDARAKLSSDGMIGNKIIEIYGGTAQAPAIKSGDIIQTDSQLDLGNVMKTLSENNDNLLGITHNIQLITSNIAEGNGTVGKLLNDATLMNQIVALTESLNRSAGNLEKLTGSAASYASKLTRPGSLANDLITDTVIISNLRQVTQSLNAVTDSSRIFISNLNTAGENFKNATQDKNTPIGMLMNDPTTTDHIRATLSNLQSASLKLDEDLEALQHNFLLRGFFKKKAKEKQRIILDTTINH